VVRPITAIIIRHVDVLLELEGGVYEVLCTATGVGQAHHIAEALGRLHDVPIKPFPGTEKQ
jgi:hypothetical protein